MQLPVLVHLGTGSIEDGVFVDVGREGELDTAVGTGNGAFGVDDFELRTIPITRSLCLQGGNLIVLHIHDLRTGGHAGRISEGDRNMAITYPGLGPEGEDLLLILLAIDGHIICNRTVGSAGDVGLKKFIPVGTTTINVLCRGKYGLGPFQLFTLEGRIDLHIVDVPMA